VRYYTVTALDADDCTVSSYESGYNRREAKREALDTLHGDDELREAGMVRVTVTDEAGEVWEDIRL
jgi:hypothetical protein